MKKYLFMFCALFFVHNLFAANIAYYPAVTQSNIEPSEGAYIDITPAWVYYTSVTIYYFNRSTGEPAGKENNIPIYRNKQTGQIAVKYSGGYLHIAYRVNRKGFNYCCNNTGFSDIMYFNL